MKEKYTWEVLIITETKSQSVFFPEFSDSLPALQPKYNYYFQLLRQ